MAKRFSISIVGWEGFQERPDRASRFVYLAVTKRRKRGLKIGSTWNVRTRFMQLRRICPGIRLVGFIPFASDREAFDLEAEYHKIARLDERYVGDWHRHSRVVVEAFQHEAGYVTA